MKTKINSVAIFDGAAQKIVKGKKKGMNSIPSFDQALIGLGIKIMSNGNLK